MFIELDSSSLEQWNHLNEEEKVKAINENEVQVAVDIEIKVESHQKIVSEHKYYQVCSYGNCKLINDIMVLRINDSEAIFSFNNNTTTISIKIDEEKELEIGQSPYTTKYIIKVSNVKYGQIFEL